MNVLAIVGSPRKRKATDSLVDKAIEGAVSINPDCNVNKLYLADYDIKYCLNCLVCRDQVTAKPYADCTLHDDMDDVRKTVHASDAIIMGTPVHMGSTPALVMAFLERICWTFAKPEGIKLNIKGCPVPRSNKKRNAVIIITSSIVPPALRRFCDAATPLIKRTFKDSLNTVTVGHLYAGDLEHRGVERYFDKATKLGRKLVS